MRLFFFFQWNRGGTTGSQNNSLYMLFWHTPVNYPLWFLRDLICMSALSPLFYAFFKYLKIYGLLILLALYLSVWETNNCRTEYDSYYVFRSRFLYGNL